MHQLVSSLVPVSLRHITQSDTVRSSVSQIKAMLEEVVCGQDVWFQTFEAS